MGRISLCSGTVWGYSLLLDYRLIKRNPSFLEGSIPPRLNLIGTIMQILLILILAFIQNVSFTMVSRSRNRDHMTYHAICSVFSNGIWFLTMRELVVTDLTLVLLVPYVVGTVCGSLLGAKVSMFIEKLLNAKT